MTIRFTNNASAEIASSISDTDTTITLNTGQGSRFPSLSAGQSFYATLFDTSNNIEIVRVTARSGDALTVTRGQDGTTARGYVAGSKFELRVVAAALSEFAQLSDDQTFSGANTFSGNNTFSGTNSFTGTNTFANPINGSVTGNAGSVTNGVYTTGDQTIGGIKTFSTAPVVGTAAEKTANTSAASTGFVDRLRSLSTPTTGASGTLVVGDRGSLVQATGTVTVPSAVFAAGDVVSIFNNSASAISIAQGSGLTLRQAGTTNTGNRTLAAYGFATVVFSSGSVAVLAGSGVS